MPATMERTKTQRWPKKVEQVLHKLNARADAAQSKLDRAIKDRNAWRQELRNMGKERTPERLNRCADLFEALEEIDYRRFENAECFEKMKQVIADADQGKFDFAVDDIEIPTKQMFLSDLAAGKPKPDANTPAAKKADAAGGADNPFDQHLSASIKDLELAKGLTEQLIANKFDTVKKLAAFVDGGGDIGEKLTISGPAAAAVLSALKTFRKRHREAQSEAEQRGKDAGAH